VGGYIVFDQGFDAVPPCFVEVDGLDALQNVDAERRKADLEDRAWVPKTGWA